ncbi:MAG: hypothetical protein FWE23_10690 [Chitinivibrionia bacterium]|nr:hypothetical protein [Chitinivibrionia bacterium]
MSAAEKLFSNLNNDGLVWALWNWNDQVNIDTIKKQFASFINDGFSGIVIRPCSNISCGTMSHEFIEYFKFVLGLAKKDKVQIMFADDFNRIAPSHFYSAVAKERNYRSQRLTLAQKSFCGAGEKYEYTPEILSKDYIVAIPANTNKVSINDAIVIYDDKNAGKSITWTAPSGRDWSVLRFACEYEKNRDGNYIPNMYNIELAKSYCNDVLMPILEAAKSVNKASFRGFMFECPAILPSAHGVVWDSEFLVPKYQSRFKKNLISLLPSLFVSVDDLSVKSRPHVYNFLSESLFDRFPAVVAKWCQQEDVRLWIVGKDCDIREAQSNTIPMIIPAIGQNSVATAFRTENLASQAAFITQSEISRTNGISTVGIVGRDAVMKSHSIGELKSAIDWQILFGADEILIDGFYLNSTYRFEDFAPLGLSFYHPDYKHIKSLVSQTKLALALNYGRKAPKHGVVVIAPPQSLLSDFMLGETEIIGEAVEIFLNVISDLRTYQIPYTIITEENFSKDESLEITNSGQIKTTNGIYSAAILLYTRLINNSFFAQVERLSLKKGTILFADKKPQGSFDDSQSDSFISRVDRMFESRSRHCVVGGVSDIVDYISKNFENIIGHLHIEKGNCGVLINHNQVGENLLMTALNISAENVQIEIAREDGRQFYKIDLESGQILNIDSGEKEASFFFVVHPREFLIILETHGESATAKQLENAPAVKIDAIVPEYRSYISKESEVFELKSLNRFPLSRWKTIVSVNRERNIINYNYETYFESMVEKPETAILVFFDKPASNKESVNSRFKVKLNGNEVNQINISEYPQYNEDPALLAYDISEFINKDKPNTITIRKTGDHDLPDPVEYPPFVLVPTAVERGPNTWKILDKTQSRTCSWSTKGYPYLIGRASALYHFEVPKNYQQVVLAFDDLSGATHIALNDKKPTAQEGEDDDEITLETPVKCPLHTDLIFPPYRIDITDYVTDKRNNLVITSSSSLNSQNQLSPGIGGILGNARLEIITKE